MLLMRRHRWAPVPLVAPAWPLPSCPRDVRPLLLAVHGGESQPQLVLSGVLLRGGVAMCCPLKLPELAVAGRGGGGRHCCRQPTGSACPASEAETPPRLLTLRGNAGLRGGVCLRVHAAGGGSLRSACGASGCGRRGASGEGGGCGCAGKRSCAAAAAAACAGTGAGGNTCANDGLCWSAPGTAAGGGGCDATSGEPCSAVGGSGACSSPAARCAACSSGA